MLTISKKRNFQYLKDTFELKLTEKSLKDRNINIDFTEELTIDEIEEIRNAYRNQLKPKYKNIDEYKLKYSWGEWLWHVRRVLCFGIFFQILLRYLSVESSTSPSLNVKFNNILQPKLTDLDFRQLVFYPTKSTSLSLVGGINIRDCKCVPNDNKYPPYNFLKLITEVTQKSRNRFVYRPVYRLPYTIWSNFEPKEELIHDERINFFKKVQTQGRSTVGFITSHFYNIFSPSYPLK